MTTHSRRSFRVLCVSTLLLSSLAWADGPDDRAGRKACINEATPLFSASFSGRKDYVARLCAKATPSTVSCVRDVMPSVTVMSTWTDTVQSLCSRATPSTAECFLGVRKDLAVRSDWLEVATAMCRRATPETLGCFREAWGSGSFDANEVIRDCGGGR